MFPPGHPIARLQHRRITEQEDLILLGQVMRFGRACSAREPLLSVRIAAQPNFLTGVPRFGA